MRPPAPPAPLRRGYFLGDDVAPDSLLDCAP